MLNYVYPVMIAMTMKMITFLYTAHTPDSPPRNSYNLLSYFAIFTSLATTLYSTPTIK